MKLSLAYNWPYILKNTLERAFFVHQISLEGRIVHKFIVSTTQMDEEITMYTVSYSLSLCQLRIITLLELSEQQLIYTYSPPYANFGSWKKCVQLIPLLRKHTVFPRIISSLEQFPPLNNFRILLRKLFKFSLGEKLMWNLYEFFKLLPFEKRTVAAATI